MFSRHNINYGNLFDILHDRRMREKGRKWDGRSRIATEEYKNNYDKVKFLEITMEPGQIIYIPAYWWYSINYEHYKTTVISMKYKTYMNTVAILPDLILKMMQKQNIKHEIIEGRNNY